MNKIVINGKTINTNGTCVSINNGRIVVDGKVLQDNLCGDINVVIHGDVNKIDCEGSVEVDGNSGNIDCGGSASVGGYVNGNVDCGGSCTCGNVSGDIDAGGSVKCRR